ncbi:LysR family transcriptional regulator [Biostraticola tofi]|uniref:DNA-binding transcriptional LysR family regulator n=1 Tax=Biostraticola tofi TaxID=466109 RepID=A0A4R3YRU7_9GAMM|nr:LysR family transcriptional regulator [Biostraticola tofi]TCV95180.1 DNA-binding transcriptional LysR family regulator [Biostraticola tofi]
MDKLLSMKVFVSAIDLGSFTAAAAANDMSPTMVGKHIRYLEQQLETALIHRTTRRQGPTEAGKEYYARCREILASLLEAELISKRLNRGPVGEIRLSAPVAFGNRLLTPLIAAFLQHHPYINIEAVLTDRKVDVVAEQFQLAFRIGAILDEGLIAHPLPDYRMVLAAAPGYLARHGVPKHPRDLSRHNCFSFSQWRHNARWRLLGPDGEHEIALSPRLRIDSGEAIRQAALAGFGIALQSDVVLQDDLQSGALVRVLPDYAPPARPMWLLRLPAHPVSVKIDAFSTFVIETLHRRQATPC